MTSARDVPALAAAHALALGSPEMTAYMRSYLHSVYTKESKMVRGSNYLDQLREHNGLSLSDLAYSQGDRIRNDERLRMNITRLFHVSESMAEVAKVAASKLPETETWGLDALPGPVGFMVFEKNLMISDVWNRIMKIKAVSWSWGRVTDITSGRDRPVTQFFFWVDAKDQDDDYNRHRAAQVEKGMASVVAGPLELAHLGAHADASQVGPWNLTEDEIAYRERYRSTISNEADGDESYVPLGDDVLPWFAVETVNMTRLVFALFQLMDQTITDLSEVQDRHLHKMHVKKPNRPPGLVTVMKLRRESDHGRRDSDGSWLTFRSVTSGHWRKQPCGPGRTEIKRIWINPYVRGPEDAPFRTTHKVSTLVR